MHAVSIIVPTLNEAANVDILLNRIFSIEALQSYDLEIIFSDGSSTDATCERVAKWFHTGKVRLVHNALNEGLAAAVIKAVEVASGEYLVVIDADLSHPPEVIPDLLEPLVADECDMVIGSRYVSGGNTPDWPTSRKLSSILATLPARVFTDVKDPLAGFIALRRERLASIKDKVYGFKIGLELLATAEKTMRVKEVPIVFRDRQYGSSKMEAKVIVDYVHQLLILAGIYLLPGGSATLCKILLTTFFIDTAVLTFGLEHGWGLGVSQSAGYILASFVAGTWAIRNVHNTYGAAQQNRISPSHVFGWCWVTLLVVFLRTGLASPFLSNDHGLSSVAVGAVSAFGLIFGYICVTFFVLSIGRKRICGQLVHRFYGIGIIAYLIVLRLVYSAGLSLLPEEQYYWSLIQSSDSLLDAMRLPFPAVVAMMFHAVFDGSVFGFRLGIWGLWFVSVVCVFNYARDVYDRSIAFKAILLYSILPFFFGTGLYVSNDAVLTMFWCGSVYILYRALVGTIFSAWIWAGLVLGFGIQVSGIVLLLIPGIIIFIAGIEDRAKLVSDNRPYLALACIALTLTPTLLVGTGNAAAAGEPLATWIESLFCGSLPSALNLAVILLTPTGLLAGVYACIQWGQMNTNILAGTGQFPTQNRRFLIGMFLVPMFIALLPGVPGKTGLYAGGVVWVALIPSMAIHLWDDGIMKSSSIRKVLHMLWWPTIVILVTYYGAMLQLQALR